MNQKGSGQIVIKMILFLVRRPIRADCQRPERGRLCPRAGLFSQILRLGQGRRQLLHVTSDCLRSTVLLRLSPTCSPVRLLIAGTSQKTVDPLS